MSLQVEKLENNTAKLTIEVPAEELDKAIQKAYQKNKNKFNVPGFRKGKVPYAMIEKMYGAGVFYEEAANDLIPEAYANAAAESELEIVARPEISVTQIEKGKPFVFEAEVTLKPEVKLGEYKGLSAKHVKPEISDDQVMAQIRQAAEQNARMEKAEEGTVLKKGDIAVIDFKGTVDGKAFEGGEGKTYPLEIGSKSFIPGFEDQLEGHKAGDDVTVSVSFPKDYFVDTLAGKEAEFAVHINDVKHKVIPVIDDAFAKSVSRHETLDELKESLKQQMQLRAFQQAEEAYHQALINQAVANSEVDIPQEMVDQRIDEILSLIHISEPTRH